MKIKGSFNKITANILSFFNFSHITTPLLISVMANVTKNLPDGIIGGIPKIALELVSQIGGFTTSQVFANLIKGKTKDIKPEDLQSVKNMVVDLSVKIDAVLKQKLSFNKEITEFAHQLVISDEFRKVVKGDKNLEHQIKQLETEIRMKLDGIRKEISVLTKVNLTKIEALLEKDSCKEPEFFRNAGPNWIDFEKGFVYERPEVNEIIEELKNKDIVVIKGRPASGKSVILRNVGYKLAKEGASVYYIELKKFLDSFASEVSKMIQGYLIVDDAHRNIDFVEHLILNKQEVKVLIASGNIDLELIKGPTCENKLAEYLEKALVIEAKDSAEAVVHNFERIKRERIPTSIKDQLSYNNLWILAWQLKAFEKEKKVDNLTVYKYIKDYVRNLHTNAPDLLLPLASLYHYEIPLREQFAKKFVDRDVIKRLLELNEIDSFESNGKEYLTLYHRDIAQIYTRVFEYYEDFAVEAKGKGFKLFEEGFQNLSKYGDHSEICRKLLISYFNEYPEELFNFIARDENHYFKEVYKEKKEAISTILLSDRFRNLIYKEARFRRIRDLLLSLHFSVDDFLFMKIYYSLDPNILKKKLNEASLEDIGNFFSYFSEIAPEILNTSLTMLDLRILGIKMNEGTLEEIGNFIRNFTQFEIDTSRDFLNLLDPKILKKKLNAASLEDIKVFLDSIDILGKPTDFLDLAVLWEKLSKADIMDIGIFLSYVSEIDLNKGRELLNNLDLDALKSKLSKSTLEEIGHIFYCFNKVNQDISQNLLDAIGLNILKNKLNEASLVETSNFFFVFYEDYPIVSRSLLANIDLDVMNEKFNSARLEDIGLFCSTFSEARELFKGLLKKINLDIIKNKINKATLGTIGNFLADFFQVYTYASREVTNVLDLSALKKKLNKSDLSEIGEFYDTIGELDSIIILRFTNALDLNTLRKKLDEASLEDLRRFFYKLPESDHKILRNILNILDLDKLREKVYSSSLEEIDEFLHYCSRIDHKWFEVFSDMLDLDILERKLNESELQVIGSFYYCVADLDTQKARKFLNSMLGLNKIAGKLATASLGDIGFLISAVNKIDSKVAQTILEMLDLDTLKERINLTDIAWIGLFFLGVAEVDSQKAVEFLEMLNTDRLKAKLCTPKIGEIGQFLFILSKIDLNKAKKFADLLDLHCLKKKVDCFIYPAQVIISLLSGISAVDIDKGREILDLIDFFRRDELFVSSSIGEKELLLRVVRSINRDKYDFLLKKLSDVEQRKIIELIEKSDKKSKN